MSEQAHFIFIPTKHINQLFFSFCMPLPSESPLYILHQKTSRAVIPKLIILLFLSAIFYGGVLLNINLLELQPQQETTAQMGALILLLIIIVIGLMVAVKRAHRPYIFYRTKIVHGKKEILYAAILNTEPHSDFLGRMFKTYSMNLGNDFHLRHISNETPIQDYIKQMMQYAKNNSQR